MEVTQDFIFQVLGANVVELTALRVKVAQLEQQLQQLQPGLDMTPEPVVGVS